MIRTLILAWILAPGAVVMVVGCADATEAPPATSGESATRTPEAGASNPLDAAHPLALDGSFLGREGGSPGTASEHDGGRSQVVADAGPTSSAVDARIDGVVDATSDAAVAPVDAAAPALGNPELGSVGLGSGGIGVSDLEKATEFFTQRVGMMVQSEVEREDRVERVLSFGVAGKPTVTLMKFKDGRNTKNIPAKLVFYATSASAAISKVSAGGYDVILSGLLGVGQVKGFDGYVLEFLSDEMAPTFVSVAFAVTDLQKSLRFYSDALGLEGAGEFYAGTLQEEFVRHPDGGAALVLQHYTGSNQPEYKNNPVKSVFHVADAAAALAKLVELGGTMVRAAAPLPAFGNRIVAIAKDLDGYIIELVQK